ncbi:hypothetical protein JCM9279_001991 [Rhodotorula babjevae]
MRAAALRGHQLHSLPSSACLHLARPRLAPAVVPRAPSPHARAIHSTSPVRLFGLRLPEPSNEPLAGTGGDASGPPWLFLAEVLLGLPAALWAYKCLMLVLFQRRIIYLPSVPPGTRNESLDDGERSSDRDASLGGLRWREVKVTSEEPTRWLRRPVELRGIEMSWSEDAEVASAAGSATRQKVVVVYHQGNAGTPLLRIPLFRSLLRDLPPRSTSTALSPTAPHVTLLAVAPRAFWRSTRSTPTERSVLADYSAALAHAYAQHGPPARYVLYGHSLGGAAAVLLLQQLGQAPFASSVGALDSSRTRPQPASPSSTTSPARPPALSSSRSTFSAGAEPYLPPISGVILENPLPSIPHMVRALYPQRWLPYHYLGPLAFDKWDALGRLERLERSASTSSAGELAPRSLWIRSGRDEIIPGGDGDGVRRMYAAWVRATEQERGGARREQQDDVESGSRRSRWVDVAGALHDTAYLEWRWRDEIRTFLAEVAGATQDGCRR